MFIEFGKRILHFLVNDVHFASHQTQLIFIQFFESQQNQLFIRTNSTQMASQNLMTSKIAEITPQCGCGIGSTKILYCRKEGYGDSRTT